MDSFTIACTGNTSIIISKFFPPIQLNGKYQIGLKSLYSYNSIFNIKEPNNILHYYKEYKIHMKKSKIAVIQLRDILAILKYRLMPPGRGKGYDVVPEDRNQKLLNKGLVSALKNITPDDLEIDV